MNDKPCELYYTETIASLEHQLDGYKTLVDHHKAHHEEENEELRAARIDAYRWANLANERANELDAANKRSDEMSGKDTADYIELSAELAAVTAQRDALRAALGEIDAIPYYAYADNQAAVRIVDIVMAALEATK